jgi:hypothetical protein
MSLNIKNLIKNLIVLKPLLNSLFIALHTTM